MRRSSRISARFSRGTRRRPLRTPVCRCSVGDAWHSQGLAPELGTCRNRGGTRHGPPRRKGEKCPAGYDWDSCGICVAEDGSVMVADTGNHCIRRISPTGEVTTHAGIPGKSGADNGKPLLSRFNSPSNLAYCPVTNDIIVADNKNHLLRRILRERVGMS
eukprot:1392876-Amorphochlora_amoeboformis.AAC.1